MTLPIPSTILVTGATGFTGRVLVKKLVTAGHSVRVIARPSSRAGDLEGLPIQWFRGEVYSPAVVAEAMEGVTVVFHIATLYRDGGADETEHQKVHVESTKLLASAATKQASFSRFIHVSTVGVHGHIDTPPADETAPIAPGDAYQRTKWEAEKWLHDFAADNDLPYTIIRPAAIYGPGDARLLKVFRMALKKRYVLLGNGKCLYHLIHVDDLTDVMIRAAWHPGALGEVFICGNPTAVTLEELGRTVAETLNHPFKVLRVPAGPVFLVADICEFVCKPFGISPPIYRRRVAFFTKDRSFDTRKVRNTLEWEPRLTNNEGIRETALAYRDQGKL